ncbi:hypothetical protein [Bacteroides acidifaciens]|nr:hypothetical protein [Bacteroides acidifaciens]MCR2000206.1 hypothetical protein [Bacteroides acidifaciens]
MKEDRRLRNLRYQMRKKGYQFDTKNLVAILCLHMTNVLFSRKGD